MSRNRIKNKIIFDERFIVEYDAGYADDFEREAKEHGGEETPCLVLKTEVEEEREEERRERRRWRSPRYWGGR